MDTKYSRGNYTIKIKIPDTLSETAKQRKINEIYDLLNAKSKNTYIKDTAKCAN